MIETKISEEAKSCADRIMANFISSGANASTAFIAAQAIEELLNQRDAELAELRETLAINREVFEIGVKWKRNSSLEEWFPITAEELAELKKQYHELLMCVARKFPNETRHQTAKRYIEEAERNASGTAEENKVSSQAGVKGGEK